MELTLPLASAHALGQRNLVGIAAMGGLGLSGKCRPAVISKPIAEGIEQRTVVDGLPQVGTALIVPVHRGSIGIVGIAVRHHGTVVVGMVLQDDT